MTFEKPLHCTNKATGESYTLVPVSTEAVRLSLQKIKEQMCPIDLAKAEGAREEREAVVRFLLERVAFRANGIPSHENIAEKIERGDHLKGDR